MSKAMFTTALNDNRTGTVAVKGPQGSVQVDDCAEIMSEMYEMLCEFLPAVVYSEDGEEIHTDGKFEWNDSDDPMIHRLHLLLAKARGES